MGVSQSVQQPRAVARTKRAGKVEIWISYPKCVESLESANFNEIGFDQALTKFKQVRVIIESVPNDIHVIKWTHCYNYRYTCRLTLLTNFNNSIELYIG